MTHAPTTPGRRAYRAVVLAMLAGAILVAPTGEAHASDWPTPAISPVDPGATYLTPEVPAGGRWTGAIEVVNAAPIARRVRISAVDVTVLEGGAFAPTARGHRQVGRWLVPAVRGLQLAPWERRRIDVRAAVPSDTAAGLYPGAIVVEEAHPSAPRPQLRVVARAALRVYLQVSAPPDAAREQAPACRAADGPGPTARATRSMSGGRRGPCAVRG